MHTNPYANPSPRELIRQLRVTRGFRSDRALALAAGIPQPTLSRYLSGTNQDMEMSNFIALARALEVTVSELLGEVPLSSRTRVAEIARMLERLSEPQQSAVLAAAAAVATALDKTPEPRT